MCSVLGCSSGSPVLPVFPVPEEPAVRLQWVQFLLQANGMKLRESSWTSISLCGLHFPQDSWLDDGGLRPGAVPSVWVKPEPEELGEPEEPGPEPEGPGPQREELDLPASLFEDIKPFENSPFFEESKPLFDDDASYGFLRTEHKSQTTEFNKNVAALLQVEGYLVVSEVCLMALVARSCPSCGSEVQLEKIRYDGILLLNRHCRKCCYKHQWRNLPSPPLQVHEVKTQIEELEEPEDPEPDAPEETEPEETEPEETEEQEAFPEEQQLSQVLEEEIDFFSQSGTKRKRCSSSSVFSEKDFSDQTELSSEDNCPSLCEPVLLFGEFSNPGMDAFASTSEHLQDIFGEETDPPNQSRSTEDDLGIDKGKPQGEFSFSGGSEEDHNESSSSHATSEKKGQPLSSSLGGKFAKYIVPKKERCEVVEKEMQPVNFTQEMKGRMKACVEKNLRVTVKTLRRNEFGRVWDKAHYCLYCKKPNMKIARHLQRKHSDEADVARAFSLPLGSQQRRRLLESLRNRGDCRHNFEVLERGSGEIVTWKQPSKEVSIKDYTPCQHCFAMFKKSDMWRHMKVCRNNRAAQGRRRNQRQDPDQQTTGEQE